MRQIGVLGQQAIRWWGNLNQVMSSLVQWNHLLVLALHPVVLAGMAWRHISRVCVCVPVKPTRGYYVTTRGCATTT